MPSAKRVFSQDVHFYHKSLAWLKELNKNVLSPNQKKENPYDNRFTFSSRAIQCRFIIIQKATERAKYQQTAKHKKACVTVSKALTHRNDKLR